MGNGDAVLVYESDDSSDINIVAKKIENGVLDSTEYTLLS